MEYRFLRDDEISVMQKAGCRCEDWTTVHVAENFDPGTVRNTVFSGKVYLGFFSSVHELGGGIRMRSGVYNACLNDVSVGDDTLIYNVSGYISNYDIGRGVRIVDCGRILSQDGCSFGCGTEISVLDETGSRIVRMFPGLSAQLAWLAVFDRSEGLQGALGRLADGQCAEVSSRRAMIGNGSMLVGCRNIDGVTFGEGVRVEGIESLNNGMLGDGTFVGPGVIMRNFIVGKGSSVDSGSCVSDTFVGEYVKIASHFSAQQSLIFSNCHFENGEICAAFAGPHTVAHHKSILLIGGMYSFFNAGSGANHSNHLYSLGPCHYGVLERGCKMASDAYVMMPAYIGAYSLIIGRHRRHNDTALFPFSYLIEKEGYSYCIPGAVLTGVGLYRDVSKWPKRDRRPGAKGIDKVVYDLLSPLVCARMLKAREILMAALAGERECEGVKIDVSEKGEVIIEGIYFTADALNKGVRYYGLALDLARGDAAGIDASDCPDIDDWCDAGGLLAPISVVKGVALRIASGELSSLHEIDAAFDKILSDYPVYKSAWFSKACHGYSTDKLLAAREDAVRSFNVFIENSAKRDLSLAQMLEKGETLVFDTSKYKDLLLK